MKYIISIEGNIGSGKSTLLELFKKNEQFIFLPEPVNIWNQIKDTSGKTILEKYYQDQKRYAFSFQMMAYITRLSLIREAIKNAPEESIIITERSIYTDREIFAKMLYDTNKIEDIEYSIYLRWFNEFSESNLHGIIYIKASPETCLRRIEHRNRKGEESIPLSYLEDLHFYHEKWINTTDIPVLFVDGEPKQDNFTILKIKDFVKNGLKKD
jgi:thymidylate kinase